MRPPAQVASKHRPGDRDHRPIVAARPHTATPCRRMVSTSVLSENGPRSNSSRENGMTVIARSWAKPTSQTISERTRSAATSSRSRTTHMSRSEAHPASPRAREPKVHTRASGNAPGRAPRGERGPVGRCRPFEPHLLNAERDGAPLWSPRQHGYIRASLGANLARALWEIKQDRPALAPSVVQRGSLASARGSSLAARRVRWWRCRALGYRLSVK